MSQGRHDGGRYDVRESRSVRSVWIWRGFLMLSLLGAGIAIIMVSSGLTSYAVTWGVISAGWFAISMYLWRLHSQLEEEEYQREQASKKRR